jgi:hypothetical protein
MGPVKVGSAARGMGTRVEVEFLSCVRLGSEDKAWIEIDASEGVNS